MKTTAFTVGEFKARFSEALDRVARGERVAVTYGRSRQPVALLVPPPKPAKPRALGMLAGKVKVRLAKNWTLSEEEFFHP
ncbi:MAG: hypothetical protein OHK005_20770 [Candidatus Methylacidiphilales bacterium]